MSYWRFRTRPREVCGRLLRLNHSLWQRRMGKPSGPDGFRGTKQRQDALFPRSALANKWVKCSCFSIFTCDRNANTTPARQRISAKENDLFAHDQRFKNL